MNSRSAEKLDTLSSVYIGIIATIIIGLLSILAIKMLLVILYVLLMLLFVFLFLLVLHFSKTKELKPKTKTIIRIFRFALIVLFTFILILLICQICIKHTSKSDDISAIAQTVTPQAESTPTDGKEASSEEKKSDTYDESSLLLEAEEAFKNEEYADAFAIYEEMIEKNTRNPIPYNNFAYFYASGLEVSADYDQAKSYYKDAYYLDSGIAAGNLLCLLGYTNFTEKEYCDLLEAAYKGNDLRVEIILEKIYNELDIESEALLYIDDFFNGSQNRIEIVKKFLALAKSENTKTGTSVGYSEGHSSYIDVYQTTSVPVINMISEQRFEYISSSNNSSISTANESEDGLLVEAQQALLDEEYQNATMIYYSLIMKGSNNPITFNNLAYLYSNGLGISEDCKKAKKYYEMAAQNGSSVAQGNLLCLISSYDSSQEYYDSLLSAYQDGNPMVEIILEEIYKTLEMQIDKSLYSEIYFNSSDYQKQIEILIDFFSIPTIISYTIISDDAGFVSVPNYSEKYNAINRIFEYQTFEYID